MINEENILSPKLRQLLSGGATAFMKGEIPLSGEASPRLGYGQDEGRRIAFLPLIKGLQMPGIPGAPAPEVSLGHAQLGGADLPFEQAPPAKTLQERFEAPPLMPMLPTVAQHEMGTGAPVLQFERIHQPVLGQHRTVPLLGQPQQLPQPASGMEAPPAAPPADPINWRKCPGPIEMPDGRIIQPDDYLKLNDVCELMPYLLEAMGQALGTQQTKGLSPGQPVPMVGQPQGMRLAAPGLGVGQGPGGGGGGGGGSAIPSPGGFIQNTPGVNGQAGPPGPPGPAGPPGLGTLTSPVVKTDGNFTAGPGAFIPVPGTVLSFSTSQAGPVVILVQAELVETGGGSPNAQLGIRVNGTDQGLARRVMHTFSSGVGEFFIGQAQMFAIDLPAGNHTVELLLRGLTAGEFGSGLGTPATLSATPTSPLILVALGK